MILEELRALLSYGNEMESLRLEAKAIGVTDEEWKKALAVQFDEFMAERLSLDMLPDRMRQLISAMRSPRSSGQS